MPDIPDELIQQMLATLVKGGAWSEASTTDRLEAAFNAFLALDDPKEKDEDADETITNLSELLDEVRVEANGGDSRARKALQSFRARLDQAIADEEIHPVNLVMLGKILWTAQLPVGDNLREMVGETMGGDAALAPENADNIAKLALRAVAKIEDPFDLYDAVVSNMAAFPAKFQVALATSLVTGRKTGPRMAAVGFVLHPEETVARAVIKAFPFSAPPSDAENAIVDRLMRVASWLPPGRREMADAAFAAMGDGHRATSRGEVEIDRLLTTACDGSGAQSLMACVQRGKRFTCLTVLMKTKGVMEVVEYGDLARKDADRFMGMMGSSSPVMEISVEGAVQLLALALGRNISAGSPPPFRLVHLCEGLGWAELRPDLSSATQILDELLAGSPVSADLAARAPTEIVQSRFVESWFEAGEGVEKLLGATKSPKTATGKVLHEYLPSRRPFWATLCATSALALRRRVGRPDQAWKEFALVGREIASETPIDRIPLMVRIAARTTEVYFERP
jgi:hypothetical protein